MCKSVIIFAASLVAIIGFCGYQVSVANADNAETFLIAGAQTPVQDIYKQQGDEQMTDENMQTSTEIKKQKYAGAWDKTKEFSGEAWDKTKELSGEAWGKTKEFSAAVWDKTKELSTEAWGTTKEAADDIHDAIMCDECCNKEHIHTKHQEKIHVSESEEEIN